MHMHMHVHVHIQVGDLVLFVELFCLVSVGFMLALVGLNSWSDEYWLGLNGRQVLGGDVGLGHGIGEPIASKYVRK